MRRRYPRGEIVKVVTDLLPDLEVRRAFPRTPVMLQRPPREPEVMGRVLRVHEKSRWLQRSVSYQAPQVQRDTARTSKARGVKSIISGRYSAPFARGLAPKARVCRALIHPTDGGHHGSQSPQGSEVPPLIMANPMIPQPGLGPAPSPLGPPGQPPFGGSPMTMPLPEKGMEAAALAQLGVVVKQLEKLAPMLGVTSEPGQAVYAALKTLAKHVPQGAVQPGMEQAVLQKLLAAVKQQGPQIAAMRGAGGLPGVPGAPGAPMPPPPPAAGV